MRHVKVEIINCINQLEFKFVFLIMWILSLGGFIFTVIIQRTNYIQYIRPSTEYFLLIYNGTRAISKLLILLLPFLSSIIYATSIVNEDKSKVNIAILSRLSKRTYIASKAIASVVVTILTVLIPLIINAILCYVILPEYGFSNRWGIPPYNLKAGFNNQSLFDFIRIQHPNKYNILYCFIVSFIAGGIALIAFSLSLVYKVRKRGAIQLSVYVGVGLLIVTLLGELCGLKSINYLTVIQMGSCTTVELILFFCLLYGIPTISLFIGCKKFEVV